MSRHRSVMFVCDRRVGHFVDVESEFRSVIVMSVIGLGADRDDDVGQRDVPVIGHRDSDCDVLPRGDVMSVIGL